MLLFAPENHCIVWSHACDAPTWIESDFFNWFINGSQKSKADFEKILCGVPKGGASYRLFIGVDILYINKAMRVMSQKSISRRSCRANIVLDPPPPPPPLSRSLNTDTGEKIIMKS